MKYFKTLIALFFLIIGNSFTLEAQVSLDKEGLYAALASGQHTQVDRQLAVIKSMKGNNKAAFEGALLMRKSATLKTPAQKLSMFKQGHKLLEDVISKEPQNLEYRFLRLMIQENAPKILNYKGNIKADSQLIQGGFKSLDPSLKAVITNYSKTSKALPAGSLK